MPVAPSTSRMCVALNWKRLASPGVHTTVPRPSKLIGSVTINRNGVWIQTVVNVDPERDALHDRKCRSRRRKAERDCQKKKEALH